MRRTPCGRAVRWPGQLRVRPAHHASDGSGIGVLRNSESLAGSTIRRPRDGMGLALRSAEAGVAAVDARRCRARGDSLSWSGAGLSRPALTGVGWLGAWASPRRIRLGERLGTAAPTADLSVAGVRACSAAPRPPGPAAVTMPECSHLRQVSPHSGDPHQTIPGSTPGLASAANRVLRATVSNRLHPGTARRPDPDFHRRPGTANSPATTRRGVVMAQPRPPRLRSRPSAGSALRPSG